MSTKKQHFDPNVKRDWGVLTKDAVEGIKTWLTLPHPETYCPFERVSRWGYGMEACRALFPEVKSDCKEIHPCSILSLSDVKKVARQAIKEWEKN